MASAHLTLGRGLEVSGSVEALVEAQRLVLAHGRLPHLEPTNLPGANCSFSIGSRDGMPLELTGTYDAVLRIEQIYYADRIAA